VETIYLDTHVVVWLFQNDLTKFSDKVLELINKDDLLISPMVIMELEFLYEIGRVTYKPLEIVSELGRTIGLKVCEERFMDSAYESIDLSWTRDPFDRLIVANAKFSGVVLVSKDKTILENYERAVW
jgi:PIN domain nuclease of toxin-antitoxin system